MPDDISDIEAFYAGSVETEDGRLNQHQLEYDLTWRYLARYLPPAGSILEIGAATGRYTMELCRRGYAVTAVDLSAALLERCRQRLAAEHLNGQVRFVVADARDLHAVPPPPSTPCCSWGRCTIWCSSKTGGRRFGKPSVGCRAVACCFPAS